MKRFFLRILLNARYRRFNREVEAWEQTIRLAPAQREQAIAHREAARLRLLFLDVRRPKISVAMCGTPRVRDPLPCRSTVRQLTDKVTWIRVLDATTETHVVTRDRFERERVSSIDLHS